jgi:hypothetical protein
MSTSSMVKVGKMSDSTYSRIKKYGEFGDTFDDLVNKVLDMLEECRSKKK